MREWEEKEDKKGKRGMGRKKQTEACIGKNWEEEPDRTFHNYWNSKSVDFGEFYGVHKLGLLFLWNKRSGGRCGRRESESEIVLLWKASVGIWAHGKKESDQAFWNFRTPKIDDRRRLWSRKLSTLMLENGEMFGRARKEETFFIFAERLPVSLKLGFGFSWEKEEEKKRKKKDPTELLRI